MADHVLTPESLRQRRKALGMTQRQLANYLGFSTNTVALWERGRRGMRFPAGVDAMLTRLEDEKKFQALSISS